MESQELKDIAPILHKLKSATSTFKVPKDYFADLEDRLLLPEINSLGEHDKKSAFKTPNDYFADVEDSIMVRIRQIPQYDQAENSQKGVISMQERLRKIIAPLAVAACLVLFFTVFENFKPTDFAKLPSHEISEWLSLEIEEINSLEIAEVYNEVSIDSRTDIKNVPFEKLEDYLTSDTIESIILEN